MALTKILEEGIKDDEITNADINTSAGIATSKLSGALTSISSHGLSTSATTDTTNASNIATGSLANARLTKPISFADTEKAIFGTDSDLEIYHDSGGNTIFHSKNGQTWIQASELYLSSDHVDGQEKYLKAVANGAVELYWDNSKKFETNSAGVKVTGQIEADEVYLRDSEKILLGTGSDLEIQHDGTNNVFKTTTAAEIQLNYNAENMARFLPNGSCNLYYDNDKKFETRSNGIMATGSSGNVAVNIAVPDNISQSRIIFSDATNTDGVITYDHNDRKLHLGAGTTSHTDGDISITSGGSVVFGDSTATPASGQQVEIRRADNTVYSPSANRANGLNIYNASGVDGGYAGIMIGSTSSSGHYGSTQLKNVSVGNGYSSDFVVQTRTGGNYGERIRVQSAGGISFNGDTASANALDDYEEGIWTATLVSGGSSITSDSSNNRYVKIGSMVFITGEVNGLTNPNGNTFEVGGLPYQIATSREGTGSVMTLHVAYGTNRTMATLYLYSGQSKFRIYTSGNATSWSPITGTQFSVSGDIIFSCAYHTV